jgi:predicted small lipoprotein YifL
MFMSTKPFRAVVFFTTGLLTVLLLAACGKKAGPPPSSAEQAAQNDAAQAQSAASISSSPEEPPPPSKTLVLPLNVERHTDDLDAMVKRRNIRALVIINPIGFFYDKGVQRGIIYFVLAEAAQS